MINSDGMVNSIKLRLEIVRHGVSTAEGRVIGALVVVLGYVGNKQVQREV